MDTDAITAAVDAALAQIAHRLPKTSSEHPVPFELQEAILEHECSKDVERLLEVEEEFSPAKMVSSLSGASGFDCRLVAPMLLREARHRDSAAAAVKWLLKVLSTREADGIALATLWGLKPEATIHILDDLQLVPFEALPGSRQKDALAQPHYVGSPRLATPPFMWAPPSAALVRSIHVAPFLRDPDSESDDAPSVENNLLFNDTRLCLAISGPTAVIPGPGWFQYTDPDLEAAVLGSATHLRYPEVTPMILEGGGAFSPETGVKCVRAFVKLEPGVKNRVRIAMGRLSQALVRRSPPDKALELAIALESLLVDSPGEHTFKIALRAALLTSSDFQGRKRSRAIIEGMYKIRSSLMHSGQSSDLCRVRGYGDISTSDVLSEALGVTALVIKKIIDSGAIPDWSTVELSPIG